jgi:hypothetical protein
MRRITKLIRRLSKGPRAQIDAIRSRGGARFAGEEIEQQLVHALGLLLVHPMTAPRYVFDAKRAGEQRLHPVGQLLPERDVVLRPDDECRRRDPHVGPIELAHRGEIPKRRAIVVDHRGERAGFEHCVAELADVLVAECFLADRHPAEEPLGGEVRREPHE